MQVAIDVRFSAGNQCTVAQNTAEEQEWAPRRSKRLRVEPRLSPETSKERKPAPERCDRAIEYLKECIANAGAPLDGLVSGNELAERWDAVKKVKKALNTGYHHHRVTGTSGLGTSIFGKLLIYELCGRLPLSQRPDVLYVYRQAGMPPLRQCPCHHEEAVHIELLYGMLAPQLHRITCKVDRIPREFWNLRNTARPLFVIIDTFPPSYVIDIIKEQSSAWHDSMRLCVYVASTESRCAADRRDCFHRVRPVPCMSEADYLRCGYACASTATRSFLRSVSGVPPESDDCTPRTMATPPERVIPVMMYLYQLMSGSPLHLLRFAVSGHFCDPYRAYSETGLLIILNETMRDYRLAPALRKVVHEMCNRHIGTYLHHRRVADDDVESLFVREVVYKPGEYCDYDQGLEYVPAGAAMERVARHLLQDMRSSANLKAAIKTHFWK